MFKSVRYLLFLILTLAFVLLAVSCRRDNEVKYEYELNENGEAIITNVNSYGGKFVPYTTADIPSEIDGHPVVEIGEYALAHAWINEIIIPNTVRKIDDFAFADCSATIGSIHIPASVQYIGQGVFRGFSDSCVMTVDSESSSFKIVDGNLYTYNMDTLIKWNDYTNSLVTVPDGVEIIQGYAFENTGKIIATAHLPETLVEISDRGFYNSGINYVKLPETLKSIGEYAFDVQYGEANMVELELNRELEKIGASVVNDLYSVKLHPENEHFKIDDGVLFSADGEVLCAVLNEADRSVSYTVPDGVKRISSFAFSEVSTFKTVNIPDSVTLIEEAAFSGCDSIVSIDIPKNVTSIEPYTFSSCRSLKTVTFSGCVEVIGDHAFSSCTSLEHVTVPDGVKTVGESAFYYCDSLKSVTVTEGVNTIGKKAFSYCKKLERVYISSTVEISDYSEICGMFDWCLSLKSIDVAEENQTVKSLDGVLYSEDGKRLLLYPACRKASKYTVPAGTEIIGDSAFKYCDVVEAVDLPDTLLIIEGRAFYECDGFDELVIPDNVTEIGEYAFCGMRFRRLVIGSGVKVIEANAFGSLGGSQRVGSVEFSDPSGWRVTNGEKEKGLSKMFLSIKFFAGWFLGRTYHSYRWEKIG